jgi:hypothetical protein
VKKKRSSDKIGKIFGCRHERRPGRKSRKQEGPPSLPHFSLARLRRRRLLGASPDFRDEGEAGPVPEFLFNLSIGGKIYKKYRIYEKKIA